MKLAVALMDKYNVSELDKYISGSVYPDSSYVTGIDRSLTHNEENLPSALARDDFNHGWETHIYCDRILTRILEEKFPELLANKKGLPWWLEISPLKIIQDINDIKDFNMDMYLDKLTYSYNPHGEDLKTIKKFNRGIQDFYYKKENLTPEDYREVSKIFYIPKDTLEKFVTTAQEHYNNKEVMKKMENVFELMLARMR